MVLVTLTRPLWSIHQLVCVKYTFRYTFHKRQNVINGGWKISTSSSHSFCSNSRLDGDANADANNHMNSDSGSVSETCVPGGEVNFSDNGYAKTAQPKFNSKLSLLGHGPHGKLVVDHLLREYGEDGIRQFCQRWRQVFVAAIQPRFLPAGWDVNHRYTELLNLTLNFKMGAHMDTLLCYSSLPYLKHDYHFLILPCVWLYYSSPQVHLGGVWDK